MTHYIDKDRIVAEIEKLKDRHKNHNTVVGMAYNMAYNDILSLLDTLEVEELPIWEKVSPDTGQTTLYKDGDKSYLERFGYRIDLKDLDKLPKKNSTHRTTADIESAMQEVEEKSEAYTNAHRGERADDVLSQMRGESVSEDLEKEIRRYRMNNPIIGHREESLYDYMTNVAKHFFELGLYVNNPVTAADRGTAEKVIINLKRVEQDYRIDLTKEMEWVRNQVKKGE